MATGQKGSNKQVKKPKKADQGKEAKPAAGSHSGGKD